MDSLQCSGEISMSENSDVLCDNHNINTTIQSDSFDETRILDEMDSYMEDLSSRLTVSRIVTDSVIKGIVHAIEQEAADQIASRDAEIMFLNQKLQQVGSASLSLSEGREKRFDELHNIRQQLDTISKALLNCERGFSVSQYNFEGVEDASKYKCKEQSSRNGVVKENGSKVSAEEVFVDPSYLKHMDKDAVIDHFNKIMNEMKRQHDSTVQEKTEEIFALKRELLKKEGPNPGHFRNNKEFEQMRKKIWEVILKLDEILLESKKTTVRAKADAFPGQREKSNAADSDILSNKEGETCSISSQASHFAPVEADFVMQIKKLESDIEDGQIENITREEIEKIVVKELVNEITLELHGSEMAFNMKQDICSVILNETVAEAVSNINLFFKNHEKNSCTRAASLQMQEIDRLKLVVDSFIEVVREKVEFISEIEFKPMKACIDSLCHELDLLRHKVTKQDSCISEKNREFDIMMGKLEQALHRAHCNKTTLTELNDKFSTVSDSLQEVEQQNNILRRVIGEKEKILQLTLAKDEEFNKSMKSVIEPVRDFGKFISDYQTNIANKIQRNESRLGVLRDQCNHLVREGNLLRKKMLWYKEISETRGSNLQKAELEVDLLGDEVDALTDLLAKIYIALDHYSPVLQHYTGVMEILNMIKKQINIAK